MKIQYCSDLHLEFKENREYIKTNPLSVVGDVLILAGDIVPFEVYRKYSFLDFVADNFEAVYWLPGNHEYYHDDISDRSGAFQEKVRSNLFMINNSTVIINNVRFIFSTLWSKINPERQWEIQQSVSDFHVIRYNGKPFSVIDYNEFHNSSLEFLLPEISKDRAEKTVVVTHHVPTLLNYPQKYRGSLLTECFAVELFKYIEPSGVDYWIYGHHHQPIWEFEIGKTKLITNQFGYVRQKENVSFKHGAVIELN